MVILVPSKPDAGRFQRKYSKEELMEASFRKDESGGVTLVVPRKPVGSPGVRPSTSRPSTRGGTSKQRGTRENLSSYEILRENVTRPNTARTSSHASWERPTISETSREWTAESMHWTDTDRVPMSASAQGPYAQFEPSIVGLNSYTRRIPSLIKPCSSRPSFFRRYDKKRASDLSTLSLRPQSKGEHRVEDSLHRVERYSEEAFQSEREDSKATRAKKAIHGLDKLWLGLLQKEEQGQHHKTKSEEMPLSSRGVRIGKASSVVEEEKPLGHENGPHGGRRGGGALLSVSELLCRYASKKDGTLSIEALGKAFRSVGVLDMPRIKLQRVLDCFGGSDGGVEVNVLLEIFESRRSLLDDLRRQPDAEKHMELKLAELHERGENLGDDEDEDDIFSSYFLAKELSRVAGDKKKEEDRKEEAVIRRRREKRTVTRKHLQNPMTPRIILGADGVPRVVIRREGTDHVKCIDMSTSRKSGMTNRPFPPRAPTSGLEGYRVFLSSLAALHTFNMNELSCLRQRWADHAQRQEDNTPVPKSYSGEKEQKKVPMYKKALNLRHFQDVMMETLLLETDVPVTLSRLAAFFRSIKKKKTGVIRLAELLEGLVILARGDILERAHMHFEIADETGKGACDREEVEKMLHLNKRTPLPVIEQIVDEVFDTACAAPEATRAVRRMTKRGQPEVTFEGFMLSLDEIPELDGMLRIVYKNDGCSVAPKDDGRPPLRAKETKL